ncbi:hypothetical protein MK280_15435, partial [Myxococcota bacterium]|nr:hypothetical protein [Myxococcota bacterium]
MSQQNTPVGIPEGTPLTESDLIEGVQLNFQGRHQDALAMADRLGSAHPESAWPLVLETYTLFWLMLYDDEDTQYDAPIEKSCRRTIKLADERLDQNNQDAEAHYLKGQALMNLGRLNGWRGRYYKAGRDGERARKHLEKTLELRPEWTDAEYYLGMYYFFVSLIPDLVTRWLGWLWFVPTGNAEEGVVLIEKVAETGTVYREDALYMKGNIYINFRENQAGLGLPIIRSLAQRYPQNVLLQFELIEAFYESGKPEAVIATANALADRKPRNPKEEGWIRMAPAWKARAALLEGDPNRALDLLAPEIAAPPENPLWATAWIDLIQAQALDVSGQRDQALALYQKILDYDPPQGSQRAARRARMGLKSPYRAPQAVAIQASP